MKKKIPSVLVSVCNPAKELLPMWIWIISDVSWLQTDSWKWKILRCERLAVGINASKVAVNVKHQSPEYRPSEIFRPLVSKLANWHPRSCNATVSRKTESYSSRSLSLRREIHLRVWSKVYSLLLTWTRRLHQATLWHSLSLKCVSLTSLHVAKTDKWPDSNALLRRTTRLSHCESRVTWGIHVSEITSARSSTEEPAHNIHLVDVDGNSRSAVSVSGVHFQTHTRIQGELGSSFSASVTERQYTSVNTCFLDPLCEVLFIPWVMETVIQASDVNTKQ